MGAAFGTAGSARHQGRLQGARAHTCGPWWLRRHSGLAGAIQIGLSCSCNMTASGAAFQL